MPVSSEVTLGVATWPIDGLEPAGVVRAAELAVHAAGEARLPWSASTVGSSVSTPSASRC